MSRDMKRRQTESAGGGRRGGSTLMGVFMGLVIGIVLAAAVAWYTSRGATPFVSKTQIPEKTAPAINKNSEVVSAAPVAAPEPSGTAAAPAPAQPMVLPGKPDDAPSSGRRFEFYDILQGKEAVPAKDPAQAKSNQPSKVDADLKPAAQPIYLQAGSFSKPNDADNQKALLAMQGVESVVQQVMVQDKTYYRVRLGPYARQEDANKARADLQKSGIEVSTVK